MTNRYSKKLLASSHFNNARTNKRLFLVQEDDKLLSPVLSRSYPVVSAQPISRGGEALAMASLRPEPWIHFPYRSQICSSPRKEALEITLAGLELHLHSAAIVSLAGAEMEIALDGESVKHTAV
jgi:hypothetical protein